MIDRWVRRQTVTSRAEGELCQTHFTYNHRNNNPSCEDNRKSEKLLTHPGHGGLMCFNRRQPEVSQRSRSSKCLQEQRENWTFSCS